MKWIALALIMIVCNSCFLFSDFKKTSFSFADQRHLVTTVVPKKFTKSEAKMDSSGNQVQYYSYPGGAVLYFALLKDTSIQLQTINYDSNIPKELYQTIFFKGIDSSNLYWRETRFGNYKAGYKNVKEGEDGTFDSSLNYFSLHMPR